MQRFNRIPIWVSPLRFSLGLTGIIWGIWLYSTWPDSFVLVEQHAVISLTMVLGSFIAGASSEGGGAIAFPVFTKLLAISPFDAKIFSLAIQSIGMSAASLTLICLRVKLNGPFILWASIGGSLGLLLGTFMIAPQLPANLIKMLFTAMISSFAWTLFKLNWRFRSYNQQFRVRLREISILLLTGFIGGIMTGLIGTGIDVICFSVMVLLFRLSEKISTPTSVVLMAINSIQGFALHYFVLDSFSWQVQQYWLAAIPVVVVFAPLGAYCCTRMSNQTIAGVLIFLISIELLSSLWLIPLDSTIIKISGLVFILFLMGYYALSKISTYIPVKSQ